MHKAVREHQNLVVVLWLNQETMGEIINALNETIPTIFILTGLFFILLAVVNKFGRVIEVQPTRQGWSTPIGISLLVIGIVLSLNTSPMPPKSPEKIASSPNIPLQQLPPNRAVQSPPQDNCSVLFREGNTLNWKIRNYGKLGNVGTLEIRDVNPTTGGWIGIQITETKDDTKTVVAGTFKGSKMSMLHPSGVEEWFGNCQGRKIEGSIKTTYISQLTFKMQW